MRPTSEKVKQPYSEKEYHTLVDYFTDKENIDLALLIRFMWNTGSRCGEALKIKLIEIELEKSRIFVANKIYKNEQEMLLLTNEAKEM